MNADQELAWLHWESAAELGYQSTLGPQLDILRSGVGPTQTVASMDAFAQWLEPGWISPQTPDPHTLFAATKQRWLLVSLRKLKPRYQSAIALAYEVRNPNMEDDGPALQSRFGIGANVVRRLLREWGKSLAWADKNRADDVKAALDVLEEAHMVWRDVRRDDRQAAKRERDSARAKGRRVNEMLLSKLLGDPVDRETEAEAWLEALGIRRGAAKTALQALTEEGRRRAESYVEDETDASAPSSS